MEAIMPIVSKTMLPALLGVVLGVAGSAAFAQNAAPKASTAPGGNAAGTPVVVLVPIEAQSDPAFYNGCWARLLDNIDKPKGKEYLNIVGKMYMPSLQTASGVDWKQKADGLSIGPKALVTVYGQENFQGPG